ncbi:restriction endonuclease subunit S [Vreelandella alkaliphila]|uniref:restriction endonuclease subunit S n=1 Tax=Vreelandella alkaliphila TaxID=272774 RepID=UPI00232CFFE9|nr:restriction endonuclease subunit S [Halomonas alkaliphila]
MSDQVAEMSATYLVEAANNCLPVGYKQTEVGVLPEDWMSCELGQAITFQRGFDLPQRLREVGNIPIISSSGASGFHNTAAVKAPSIVTGRYGTIGNIFYLQEDFWPLNTTLYVREFKKLLPEYALHILKTVDFASHSGKSGVPGVNRNDLHQEKIAVPPIEEQIAIANALSAVDALISELEKLIAKKQAIKTATMQQLLTGRTRLPEFALHEDGTPKGYKQSELGEIPEDWKIITLGAASSFINGRAYALYEWENNGTPVIRLQNLTGRGDDYYYSNLPLPEKQYCSYGDLLFMWSATFGPVIWKGSKAIYHYHIWKISCESGYSQDYMFYLLDDMTEKLKRSSSSGGTMLHVTKEKMESTKAAFPDKEEQVAIASILSDMDKEIQALEQRLGKTRQIKQGMMQELLTGKTRLVKPANEIVSQ